MNVQNTTEYGMRDVAVDTSSQRFSFNIFNRISAFKVVAINVEAKWQAGHTGDHRMLLLVGEYPQPPPKR